MGPRDSMSAAYRSRGDGNIRAELAAEPDAGVLVNVADPNLEMQMRTCRPPSRSFVPDQVTAGDDLPARHVGECRQVPVVGRVAVAMEDDDVVSVAGAPRIQVD